MCWQWYFWGFVLRRGTGSFSIECNTQVRDYYWRWKMKAKGFYFSEQFGCNFLCDFRPALTYHNFQFLKFFLTLIVLTFIYLPHCYFFAIFHDAHQTVHLHCFSRFSGSLISHSSVFPLQSISFPCSAHFSFICFSSATHSSPSSLHLPLCAAWCPSPSNPPSHMLLFSLSAVTVSLAGLGNSVQCALLSRVE